MGVSDFLVAGINKGYSAKFASDWKTKVQKCKLTFYGDLIIAYNHIIKMRNDKSLNNNAIINSIVEGYGINLTPLRIMDFHLNKINEIYSEFEKWCETYGSKYPDSIKVLNEFGEFYNKVLDTKKTIEGGNAQKLEDYYIKARAEKELLEKTVTLDKYTEKKSTGWGVCIILLFVLPPIGLILIISKAFSGKGKKKKK